MNNGHGTVFWLTGLSGSGKTTLGAELTEHLRKHNHPVIFLDGDNLREVAGDIFGHDREQRLKASLLYSRLCHMIASQNIHVVCATISLFHETQNWNQKNITNYIEIFMDIPLPELIKRDSKKIYSRAEEGILKNVVGVDIQAEYPQDPSIIVKHQESVSDAVEKIFSLFKRTINHAYS